MVFVDKEGYLTRKPNNARRLRNHRPGTQIRYRNWFTVKATSTNVGTFHLGGKCITVPKEYVGKKVRFKIELVEDDWNKDTAIRDQLEHERGDLK